jgi:hypothetical protein
LPKRTHPEPEKAVPSEAPEILQFKIWLLGISPMIWRRVQVSATMTLRELHGVIQVVMGWEGCVAQIGQWAHSGHPTSLFK